MQKYIPTNDTNTSKINIINTLKRITIQYLLPHKKLIIISIVCNLIAALTTGVFPYLLQQGIDQVFTPQTQNKNFHLFTVTFIIIIVVKALSIYISNINAAKLQESIVYDTRNQIFKHYLTLDIQTIMHQHSGNYISIFLHDTVKLATAIDTSIVALFRQFITAIVIIIVMFTISVPIALSACAILVPYVILLVRRLGKKAYKKTHTVLENISNMGEILSETFAGLRTIKSYQQESAYIKNIQEHVLYINNTTISLQRNRMLSGPVTELAVGILLVLIFVFVQNDYLSSSIGEITAIITAFALLRPAIVTIITVPIKIQEGLAASIRILNVVDTKPKIVELPNALPLEISKAQIQFQDVNLTYSDNPERILQNINLTIPTGNMVAFVGESGSGKTSLLNLVSHFLIPDSGTILIDGQDINKVTFDSLHKNIALVTQDTFLFYESVLNNILLGNPKASKEDVIESAKNAGAHQFIMKLPHQYDTVCGEGGMTLSGGQRQRISIARAFLKNAPILLLDEATSALDTNSEYKVQIALNKLMKNKTCIIISHRLSTIEHADKIYVIEEGEIVQSGTHQELLKEGKAYGKLNNLRTTETH